MAASLVARIAPTGKAAAKRLGQAHDIRGHAGPLVAEQFAGAAHPALHLVEYQHQTVLVAQFAQRPQERRLDNANAAFAHQRLDQDRRGFIGDRALDRFDVAERNLIEALDHGAEAFEIFFLPAGSERRQRPAVERAFKGDDAIALGVAAGRLVFACAS